ncbi:MAG TPA: cystathionine beta-lyase [Lentisphaeria bacterium]|nr:MAG: cystathionine beta-lyase [Lentisphaerae bacterium GWF2_38_69]HBM17577.1 cystathionine beta-lyase [Lentisphaeria bacterium]
MKEFCPEQAMVEVKREFDEFGGVAPSICRSSTFTVMEPGTMPDIFHGKLTPDAGGCYLYSRHFNPTVKVLDRYLAAMENTQKSISTASGMAAISCALLQSCKSGDHIIASNTVYGGTYALLACLFKEIGIEVSFVDPVNTEGFEKAIRDNTKLIYTETIANPTLKISDISKLSAITKKHGLKLIVDNTFTPMIITPARLGADVVVYSMTKYINGASDLLAGSICSTSEFIDKLMDLHTGRVMLYGPTIDARVAFDIIQRIPSLALRMREHARRALAMSEMLENMKVKVSYPGLKSHPQHELMDSMINKGYGYGGLLTIDCITQAKAYDLMRELQNVERFGLLAVSLGYFDTLISCSSSSTSSEIPEDKQAEMGLSNGLIRISVGITGSLESRMEQLERAVRKVLL